MMNTVLFAGKPRQLGGEVFRLGHHHQRSEEHLSRAPEPTHTRSEGQQRSGKHAEEVNVYYLLFFCCIFR